MAKLGVLTAMENCLEQVVGKSIAAKVMEGSEEITEKTDKKKVAQWTKTQWNDWTLRWMRKPECKSCKTAATTAPRKTTRS